MIKKKSAFLVLGLVLVLASCSNNPFVKVDEVTVLSALQTDDFATSGEFLISLIPSDKNGDPIVTDSIQMKAEWTNSSESEKLVVSEPTTKIPTATSLPWAIGIDIDASGSMTWNDPDKIRVEASKNFVTSILTDKSESEIAIGTFSGYNKSDNFSKTTLLQDFSSDKSLLFTALETVPASGLTPLWDSSYEFLDYLSTSFTATSYQRIFLILSDGSDTNSSIHNAADVKAYAMDNEIPVHTVALSYNSSELQDISLSTGGIYIHSTDATTLKDSFNNVSRANIEGYLTYTITFPSDSIPRRGTEVMLELAVKNALSGEKIVKTEFTVE